MPGAVDAKTIEALKSKDDIMKALKDSYTYAHAAISTHHDGKCVYVGAGTGEVEADAGFDGGVCALRTPWITTGRWWSICG